MAGQFDEQTLRQYLLGLLDETILVEFEQTLLTNDQAFEELLAAEHELIDEYLSSTLTEDERVRFKQHFLATPERHENLRFARALRRYVPRTAVHKQAAVTPSTNFWVRQRWGVRAVLALALVVIIVVAVRIPRPGRPTPRTFQPLALTISINNRANSVPAPKVKLNADALKLSLKLSEPPVSAVRYRVALDNLRDEHAELKSFTPTEQDAQSLLVVIPAAQLARGRYSLKLFAIKADGTEQRINGGYDFDVE